MIDDEQQHAEALRERIEALVGEYVAELNNVHGGERIPTAWVLVVGMTEVEWTDGRESLVTIHRNVPFSTRLGLLTSAQHDLVAG